MLTFKQPKLEIVQCDNGYVVEWRDESRDKGREFRDDAPPTAGVKIFETKKQVAEYLASFFGDR